MSQFLEIRNDDNEVIYRYEVPEDSCTGDFDSADLQGLNLERGNFVGKFLYSANFDRANLRYADFYWGALFQATFRGADLEGACFRGADCKEADFEGANLRFANFSRDNLGGSTSLQGANLTKVNFQGTQFVGATYDAATRFPPNFDPVKARMVLSKEGRRRKG